MGELADNSSNDEIFFEVTVKKTFKYKYPMEANELYDARQMALESTSQTETMYLSTNDAELQSEEIQEITVVEGDGSEDWFE
tara:strand:+ start:377 stop:622 length:246 start_codon:yes stop_codon:yes gene_type:complete